MAVCGTVYKMVTRAHTGGTGVGAAGVRSAEHGHRRGRAPHRRAPRNFPPVPPQLLHDAEERQKQQESSTAARRGKAITQDVIYNAPDAWLGGPPPKRVLAWVLELSRTLLSHGQSLPSARCRGTRGFRISVSSCNALIPTSGVRWPQGRMDVPLRLFPGHRRKPEAVGVACVRSRAWVASEVKWVRSHVHLWAWQRWRHLKLVVV